jgi:heat shock protein HtpX
MPTRILLFVGVNFLVVMTLSLIMSLAGVRPYITSYGLDIHHLAIFCAIWGMGGALISLAISRATAKFLYKIEIVSPHTMEPKAKLLVELVNEYSRKAKLPVVPEIGIYPSEDLNAFATGPTKSRSLVAVSSGLLRQVNHQELAGVIGHEISHIANDDMVTMTLLQGVVNAFVMFMARALAYAVTIAHDDEEGHTSRFAYSMVRWVFELVFMALGSILVCWFSRHREFRADAGGSKLAGVDSMAAALNFLRMHDTAQEQALKRGQPLQAMMISGGDWGILSLLYATHPPLDQRINRLYAPEGDGKVAVARGKLPTRAPDSLRSTNSLRDRMGKDSQI